MWVCLSGGCVIGFWTTTSSLITGKVIDYPSAKLTDYRVQTFVPLVNTSALTNKLRSAGPRDDTF